MMYLFMNIYFLSTSNSYESSYNPQVTSFHFPSRSSYDPEFNNIGERFRHKVRAQERCHSRNVEVVRSAVVRYIEFAGGSIVVRNVTIRCIEIERIALQ